MDIKAFVRWIVSERCDSLDIDGGDLQEKLIEHGLLIERPATQEDCETDAGLDYDMSPGDPWLESAPELKAFLDSPCAPS